MTYQGETKKVRKVKLVFEVPSQTTTDGKIKTIGRSMTASLHDQATLRKTLNSWLGGLTAEQACSLDLDSLIGKSAKLLVIHKEIDGRVMHMIESIQPSDQQLEVSSDYVRLQDREEFVNGSY